MTKLTTPGMLNSGDTMSYALGIRVGEYRGQRLFSHTGGDIAHRTLLSYYPDLDAGIVLMSNNSSFPLGIGTQVLKAFFADQLEPAAEEKKVDGVQVDPEILKTYAGKYNAQEMTAETLPGLRFLMAAPRVFILGGRGLDEGTARKRTGVDSSLWASIGVPF